MLVCLTEGAEKINKTGGVILIMRVFCSVFVVDIDIKIEAGWLGCIPDWCLGMWLEYLAPY